MVQNPDLEEELLLPISDDVSEKFGECVDDIEQRGCGLRQLQEIAKKYVSPGKPWIEGIVNAPDSENSSIAKAVAEWADGDTVALHYAYGNDYVCTRDVAKSAGEESVFSSANMIFLERKYGIKSITPEELANLL
jgi:endonuclease YncB( thermonuclease family)